MPHRGMVLTAGFGAAAVVLLLSSSRLLAVWSPSQPSQTELQAALATLEQQLRQVESRLQELDALASPTLREVLPAEAAFAEAERLGIVEEIARARPRMAPERLRRVSVSLVNEARRHRLDPLLLTAVARVESGYNPFATSHAGARGLLQLMIPTSRELLERRGEQLGHEGELYDIETNVALGAEYLARMITRFPTLEGALLAYNRGPTGARAVLGGDASQRALAGYPRLVLDEHRRLARRAVERHAARQVEDSTPTL